MHRQTRLVTIAVAGIWAFVPVAAMAQFNFREAYTKAEFQIPMRDGVKLYTSVYIPKDTSKKHPIMLERTPYSAGPYGADRFYFPGGALQKFAQAGYIIARQDVRGRFMSEGVFEDVRPHVDKKRGTKDVDESSDTYDTVDWLVKNVPGNNGKVGIWGISYPGFYASAATPDTHPALKAVSPQAPVSDWFRGDDIHHRGAFFIFDEVMFDNGFDRPHPGPQQSYPRGVPINFTDAYQWFLEVGPVRNFNEKYFHNELPWFNKVLAHGNLDDFWKAHILPPHLKNVHCAVLTVGGWFDAEDLYGTLHTYAAIEKQNPGIQNSIIMGPWTHGGWFGGAGDHLAEVSFGGNTHDFYADKVLFPFFDHYLNDGPDPKLAEAIVFNTGSNRWLTFDKWPPADQTSVPFYLDAGKAISSKPSKDKGFDEYISDPANPVPYTGHMGRGRGSIYMIEDQRFASSSRLDVLSYQTEPFKKATTFGGPVTADLYVSTTGTDADFVVKVIDVYPDDAAAGWQNAKMSGYQQLVRAEIQRGKFRNSFEKPQPFTPGKVERVKFDLPDVCHTFLPGHRLMIQVQSSWFPLVDRNPQKFVDIYSATESDFQKATIRIYHSPTYPSQIRMRTIEAGMSAESRLGNGR